MLSDLERKLLRILYNFSYQQRRMPTVPELERKTGRTPVDITHALDELVAQEYILWPDRPHLDTITILEPDERNKYEGPKPRVNTGSTAYWTQY